LAIPPPTPNSDAPPADSPVEEPEPPVQVEVVRGSEVAGAEEATNGEAPPAAPAEASDAESPAAEACEAESPTAEEESESGEASDSGEAKEPGFGAWWKRRQRGVVRRWSAVGEELSRTRLVVKVFLLHVRYVFGYLAFGYLVSAPLQIGRLHEEGWLSGIATCLALGVVCLIPFLVLYPFTRIAWERMRIPEFKNLELALTGWAAIAAAVFVAATGIVRWPLGLEGAALDIFNPNVAWLCFGLMFFAWVRVKFHTVLFREFYTLRDDDDLVLRVPGRGSGKTKRLGQPVKSEEDKDPGEPAPEPKRDPSPPLP